jgi:hypothetical protein
LLSVHRLWNIISRHRPPPGESIPQERSKRKFFARRTRSDSPLEPTTVKANQLVPKEKVREGEDEQGVNIDDVRTVSTLVYRHLNATAVSVILGMIHSAPKGTKANSETILPPTRRVCRLTIVLFLPTSSAKIIEAYGND